MATFTRSDDLQGAQFVDANLHGARFGRADLSGVVMREVDVARSEIDAPWLSNGESFLLVNGVEMMPLVEAELNRRFPGRAERRATDPDDLRAAWAALERTWASTCQRAAPSRACTSSSRRSGSTTATPRATSTRSRPTTARRRGPVAGR